jgi:hypothetical protein
MPDPNLFEVMIGKLKRHKAPGIDQILAKLIRAGAETFRSEVHKVIYSTWNKEELQQQSKESITVPIYKKNKTDSSNY